MRLLLDENLDWRLGRELSGVHVDSVPRIGWAGISNGRLLARAELAYDVLVTMDRGLPYQQNLEGHDLALIGLRAVSNRLKDTRPLMPAVLEVLPSIAPGKFRAVGDPSSRPGSSRRG